MCTNYTRLIPSMSLSGIVSSGVSFGGADGADGVVDDASDCSFGL